MSQALGNNERSCQAASEGPGVYIPDHLHRVVERRRGSASQGNEEESQTEERERQRVDSRLRRGRNWSSAVGNIERERTFVGRVTVPAPVALLGHKADDGRQRKWRKNSHEEPDVSFDREHRNSPPGKSRPEVRARKIRLPARSAECPLNLRHPEECMADQRGEAARAGERRREGDLGDQRSTVAARLTVWWLKGATLLYTHAASRANAARRRT